MIESVPGDYWRMVGYGYGYERYEWKIFKAGCMNVFLRYSR